MSRIFLLWMLSSLLLASCFGSSESAIVPGTITLTPSSIPTPTIIPLTLTASLTPSPTETLPPSSTPEPFGCQKPPDDYTRVEINSFTLNQRTLAMLAHAQQLYGGEPEITNRAITQGSYTNNVSASFGTHEGGGAVDLSVLRRGTYTVLWDDIEPLIHALRVAGFAAWLREYGELYPNSPIHIHVIAIGDRELSRAAQDQLVGPAGYFRGYDGLPVAKNDTPKRDRYGGPILCQWMIDLGYQDLR